MVTTANGWEVTVRLPWRARLRLLLTGAVFVLFTLDHGKPQIRGVRV